MRWRILICIAVIAWVFAGTLFYFLIENCKTVTNCDTCPCTERTECGWTFGQSFYYSVQTGLSIGFGLLAESKDGSRAYSIFHILAGSSVIGGCLSWFASATLERHAKISDHSERELARFAHACHVDGYNGFSVVQLRELFCKYPQFAADFVYKLDKDHKKVSEFSEKFLPASHYERQNMSIRLIERAQKELDIFDKDMKTDIDHVMKVHDDRRSMLRMVRQGFENHSEAILIWSGWCLWIAIGAIVSASNCGWSWIQGIYFAVAACSTAGLEAICEAGESHVVLTGIYSLIGVPIFGLALGRFAGVIVDRHMARKNHQKMTEKISNTEMAFVEHILGHAPDSKIDFSEFLEIQLLRIGVLDRDALEEIKGDFDKLSAGKGFITRDVAMKGHEHRVHQRRPQVLETSI